MTAYPIPLLGFAAYSGTGKTTLLSRLIPLLRQRDLRVGVIKHAHHDFDIDHPEKDSARLRRAGAEQMLIASRRRIAWVEEQPQGAREPTLADVLGVIDPRQLDLVLVEGFKASPIPKIELHRQSLRKPWLFPEDRNIIAIATDYALQAEACNLPRLDLNDPAQIADFIEQRVLTGLAAGPQTAIA